MTYSPPKSSIDPRLGVIQEALYSSLKDNLQGVLENLRSTQRNLIED